MMAHSMTEQGVPFAVSEDWDWFALPGHIDSAAAEKVLKGIEGIDLARDFELDPQEVRVRWKHKWVRYAPQDNSNLPYWVECTKDEDGAEPATIWSPI